MRRARRGGVRLLLRAVSCARACQVPRLSLPSVMGMFNEQPNTDDLTCAACGARACSAASGALQQRTATAKRTWHVVGALRGVHPGRLPPLRHRAVEPGLHIGPHVGVAVLVDRPVRGSPSGASSGTPRAHPLQQHSRQPRGTAQRRGRVLHCVAHARVSGQDRQPPHRGGAGPERRGAHRRCCTGLCESLTASCRPP
jgi:hypothetical protein